MLGVRGNREFVNAPQDVEHASTNVVQCRDCSFIYCDPTIIGADILEATHYSKTETYSTTVHEDVTKPFAYGLATILRYSQGGKLLDVGAGKGEFLSIAGKKGFLVHGFEPSREFCNFASREFGIDIHCGDLKTYKSFTRPKLAFDVISLFHVLEHIKDPKTLLLELQLILSSEGICYIEVPNADASLLRIVDKIYKIIGRGWSSRLSPLHPPFHSIGYTPKSIRLLLENSGFHIMEIHTFSGRNRGHQIDTRFGSFKKLLRGVFVGVFDFLPNKELIGIVVRSKGPSRD
jgi:2-polyprenyl-3-methyl-5-hydroxy-6-metoxy-1,4-benzoquinol methylase